MLTRLIFTLTLFCSAFLSFSIQPILGKMLLPIVGGAPAGWIVAMAFFQIALLGGYALSHMLQRVSPLRHGLMILALYCIGFLCLPVRIDPQAAAIQPISLAIILVLVKTIFLPFIALTATTSALLRIFSHTDQSTAQDPYYLFTASNAGSLIGLFVYPLALEPFFGLKDLSHLWLTFYGLLTISVLLCLFMTRKSLAFNAPQPVSMQSSSPLPFRTIASWFCLAFVPCSLSMSLTTFISTDMGSFPLLWTLPLGFYLLSFVLGFARRSWLSLDNLRILHITAGLIFFFFLVTHAHQYQFSLKSLAYDTLLLLGLFFVICWSCHQTLAAQRPSAQHLTFYYLIIAFGGAVAGILNAFIFPLVLDRLIEFPISLILSFLLPMILNTSILRRPFPYQRPIMASLLILAACMLYACFMTQNMKTPDIIALKRVITVIFFIVSFIIMLTPRHAVLLFSMMTLYYAYSSATRPVLLRERNFFGAVTISEQQTSRGSIRMLRHGNTMHGAALYDVAGQPTYDLNLSYYSPLNPIQDVYSLIKPQHIAVMGLGAGQLACFPTLAKTTYFEIDPDVVHIAQSYFPYLKKCPPKNIVMGDARIEFSKQTQPFDILLLDVFSSDGIPMHIITQDAIAMYRKHMSPNGVLLFHTSNRYLSLIPQIGASARNLGLPAYSIFHIPDKTKTPFALDTQWVAIPLNPDLGAALIKENWAKIEPGPTVAWTDERSSVLTAIKPIADRISGHSTFP